MKERNGSAAMSERRGFWNRSGIRETAEQEIWQCNGIPGIKFLIRI
jgi:hypothetical protein